MKKKARRWVYGPFSLVDGFNLTPWGTTQMKWVFTIILKRGMFGKKVRAVFEEIGAKSSKTRG